MFQVHCLNIINEIFYVSSPVKWYKKFRTYNNGSLQQAWASSIEKSTTDDFKEENWGFKVLGLIKWGILAA